MSLPSWIRTAAHDFLPPIVQRGLRRLRKPVPVGDPAMDAFYATLVTPGSLCFDVGANVGLRTASLRRLGCRVVAVDPQSSCQRELRRRFAGDREVVLVKKAAGATVSTAVLHVADASVLSTLSPDYITATTESGRFAGTKWDKTETVEVTTLDSLMAEFGVPDFVKVDVEGFELEVVKGLSRPLKLVALEWAPETTRNILGCVERLSELGPAEFNVSWGESMRLSQRCWMNRRQLEQMLEVFRDETYLFADIYVRTSIA